MPRQNSHKHHDESHYRRQEYPATELAEALGLPAADRFGYDYSLTLALKERLADICTRCAIRFGIPDQNRKHLGDAIGLPDEPVLRYPHHEINIDPRWEKLANALRFPSQGDFPLVNLLVASAQELNAIRDALPSLLEDIDLKQRPRQKSADRAVFRPITRKVGDELIDKIDKVKAYGNGDSSPEGTNRTIARNMHRQMRIYMALGPEWTLVNSLENLVLTSYTLPPASSKPIRKVAERVTTTEPSVLTPRWNRTGEQPKETPPTLPGLTWMWARHEGKHLPAAWGGPQQGPWGRWEPQFPDTNKPNTSLFGHSSVYIQIDLESNHFRDRATKKFLATLREMKHDFEEIRRTARRDEYFSENFETVITSRLIKRQDDLLDRIIQSHTT